MSGGSLGYLFQKDVRYLLCEEGREWLDDAYRRCNDANLRKELDRLWAKMDAINDIIVALDVDWSKLRPVMKALEWWLSCDYSEDQFKAAVYDWMNGKPQ